MNLIARQKKTFALERCRAVPVGVIESFAATFFLLIAITHLHAGDRVQAFVATGGSLGLLLGPLLVQWVRKLRCPVNRALAATHGFSAACLLVASVFPTLPVFVTCGVLALVSFMSSIPLATQFYQQNYMEQTRGHLFSISSTIRVGVVALATWLIGKYLSTDPQGFRWVPLAVSAAAAASSALLWRSPGDPLPHGGSRIPFHAVSLLWRNRAFAWLIGVYMLMGFANLMMLPLRIKFLVEPRYGHEFSEAMTAFYVGVIPAVTVFLFTWWWGRLFDKVNFFVLRAVLNVFFLLSIGFFFLFNTPLGFVIGSFFQGMAFAGGNVAWSLWVTKIAPHDEVADYMSVHTFTTGIRAFLAPMVSIPLAAIWPMSWLVALSTGLIVLSIAMLGPEIQTWRSRRPAQPISPGISE